MPNIPIKTNKKCPICGEPTDKEYRPFCSRKCHYIDLNRWLSNGYVIYDDEEQNDKNNPTENS